MELLLYLVYRRPFKNLPDPLVEVLPYCADQHAYHWFLYQPLVRHMLSRVTLINGITLQERRNGSASFCFMRFRDSSRGSVYMCGFKTSQIASTNPSSVLFLQTLPDKLVVTWLTLRSSSHTLLWGVLVIWYIYGLYTYTRTYVPIYIHMFISIYMY